MRWCGVSTNAGGGAAMRSNGDGSVACGGHAADVAMPGGGVRGKLQLFTARAICCNIEVLVTEVWH